MRVYLKIMFNNRKKCPLKVREGTHNETFSIFRMVDQKEIQQNRLFKKKASPVKNNQIWPLSYPKVRP